LRGLTRNISGRGNRHLHALDRYAGIPLLLALGAGRRRRSVPSAVRTIGVLNTAAIGDTILMGAAIADLRSAYPEAQLIAFSAKGNAEATGLLTGLDGKITLSLGNLAASIQQLRRYRLDLLLDFGPWPRINAVLCALAGANFTVGFRTAKQHRHYAYDAGVEHRSDVHELDNHRNLVRAIGLEAWHLPLVNCRSESAPRQTEKLIVFHLWPGGMRAELKEWPLERWARLASELITECDRIILTGAPGQFSANETLLAMIKSPLRSRFKNAAGLPLDATASLLEHASLVVSVNTGIMHLAAALGAPVVALHGPTSVRRWGPIGPRALAIESPCRGCGFLDLGFEYRHKPRRCMEAIPYRMVREACARFLNC